MVQRDDAMAESIRQSAAVIAALGERPCAGAIAEVCGVIAAALERGNKLLTAGHGGSAADALHLAEELVGRFDADRRPLPAIALVADPTLLTCIANDYGFTHVFPRQVEALGQPGDVLVIFSTSGKGDGLRMAVEAAKRRRVTTVALLGKGGGPLAEMVDHKVVVPSDVTARVQEAHTLVLHLILEHAERELFGR